MVKSIIFCAPSGSGKTTISKHILKTFPNIKFSVSATTRLPRPGEVDGKDYHFISVYKFLELVKEGKFIEWEEVYHNQYYGTLLSDVQRIWDNGDISVFDVDVAGAVSLSKKLGDESLSFFIKVQIEELERRLISRGTETPKNLNKRLNKAAYELTFESCFDVVVDNTNLDTALKFVENKIDSLNKNEVVNLPHSPTNVA